MIPKKLLNEILNDPWYYKCCICGVWGVQLHHHIIFKGRQLNEKFAIVPLCVKHHTGKEGTHSVRKTKEKVNLIVKQRYVDAIKNGETGRKEQMEKLF